MSLISGAWEVILYFASKLCFNCGWIHHHFGKSSEPTLYNWYQSSKEITANVNLKDKGFNFPASCMSTGLHINAGLWCHSNHSNMSYQEYLQHFSLLQKRWKVLSFHSASFLFRKPWTYVSKVLILPIRNGYIISLSEKPCINKMHRRELPFLIDLKHIQIECFIKSYWFNFMHSLSGSSSSCSVLQIQNRNYLFCL